MDIKYRKPVRMDRGKMILRARLKEQTRKIAGIEVKLFDGEGQLCTEGVVSYFIMTEQKAKEEMHYPGRDAFYLDSED